MQRSSLALASCVVAALLLARNASASCGQAFCTVDSRVGTEKPLAGGQLRLDLSTEYIEQDQPWIGFHSAAVGEIPRADHQEVESTNLTWKLNTEVGLNDRWSIGLLIPLVHREHLHLSSEMMGGEEITIGKGTGVPERWNFTDLGDLQVVARFAVLRATQPWDIALSLLAGLKLPTGKTDVRDDNGEEGEITLQPGTGSVDPLIGATLQRGFSIGGRLVPAFLGVVTHATGSDGRFGFRPGTEVLINTGASYPLTAKLSALGQINFRYKDRDHAGEAPGVAEEHTGGENLFLSPGLHLMLAEHVGLYSYVQVPVLQRVNGIQVVSRWNLLFGLTYELDL